jgi:hypothetical protein
MGKTLLSCVLLALALFVADFSVAIASAPTQTAASADITAIYTKFLSHWNGGSSHALLVSESAEPPTSEDMAQYKACAQTLGVPVTQWIKANPIANLRGVIGNLSYVHFVNPKQWRPMDPRALMARGKSVDAAVSAGVDHSLVTLSAISFNASHTLAMFEFSSVCGGLCGAGGVVVFKKTPEGWVEQKSRGCARWIS